MRISFSRDLRPRSIAIWRSETFQFAGQKTAQSCIRFPFDSRRVQLDLDRIAMLAHHFVLLRVRNNVNPGESPSSCGNRRVAWWSACPICDRH